VQLVERENVNANDAVAKDLKRTELIGVDAVLGNEFT
jgi:hypothetical protein